VNHFLSTLAGGFALGDFPNLARLGLETVMALAAAVLLAAFYATAMTGGRLIAKALDPLYPLAREAAYRIARLPQFYAGRHRSRPLIGA
jgi:hypothetical protein